MLPRHAGKWEKGKTMTNIHPVFADIFKPMLDYYSGKLVDKPSDLLPQKNGGICETCGTETIDKCPRCGAPQCCPECCMEGKKP